MILRALLAALLLALGGCAFLPTATRGAPGLPAREAIDAFHLEGRMVVRRGAERYSAGIVWRHGGGEDDLLLSGPLGQGVAHLAAGAAGAVLETADRQRYEAADIDVLAQRVFGLPLPVSAMVRWVLGRCQGECAMHDALGRPAAAEERGWAIEYQAYESDEAQALPTLLRARRDDIEVVLKVDFWAAP